MSRTDKDRPYWVRLNDPTEEHRDSYWFGFDVRREWTPSREERRTMYYGPLRRATRDTMRNAVKDYNTYADVDEDFYLQGNHRHVQVPRRRLVKVARFEDLLMKELVVHGVRLPI